MRLGECGEQHCHQTTSFAEVALSRLGCGRPGHSAIHPLDESLALKQASFSCEIQPRAIQAALKPRPIQAAVEGPFDEAIERLEESTGAAVRMRSPERMALEPAVDLDALCAQKAPPAPEDTRSVERSQDKEKQRPKPVNKRLPGPT